MPSLKIADYQVHYEDFGQGEPLLILTGWACNFNHIATRWKPLGKYYRVIIIDLRGSGSSSPLDRDYSIADHLADVIKVIDSLGIKRFHLLGNSFGGMIAIELLLKYPERVAKAILLSTSPKPKSLLYLVFINCLQTVLVLRPSVLKLFEWILKKGVRPKWMVELTYYSEIRQGASLKTILNYFKAMMRFNAMNNLTTISNSVLVLTGQKDRIFSFKRHTRLLYKRLPNAKLALIPNGNHAVFFKATPEVISEVTSFLKS